MIYIPIYKHPHGFVDLDEAVSAMGCYPGPHLHNLVRYNLEYRDFARANGVAAVVERLKSECPRLADMPDALDNMTRKLERTPIGEHDIFYWPKDKPFGCMGKEMALDMLLAAVEVKGRADRYWKGGGYVRHENFSALGAGLHVALLAERPPCFDEYDRMYDNGEFRNFFIAAEPFSDDKLDSLMQLDSADNSCKITENIPDFALPAVYHNTSCDYFLMARRRDQLP